MEYINNACWHGTVEKFLTTAKNEWLDTMVSRHETVSAHELTQHNIESWEDCHRVMIETLASLPKEYRNLYLIFEYVLPAWLPGTPNKPEDDPGVRADVILLDGSGTVSVLEFKNRPDLFVGHLRETRKYRNRLRKWHRNSDGLSKKAALVLTQTVNRKEYNSTYKATVCSPDKLASVLQDFFPSPKAHRSPKKWMNSEYSATKKMKKKATTKKESEQVATCGS